ncbi:hypothetical protein TNCV_3125321 [Trichonephila clavipes]|nr:hypothetical protein TNCV_3125321 [Trichonephila clavipes]
MISPEAVTGLYRYHRHTFPYLYDIDDFGRNSRCSICSQTNELNRTVTCMVLKANDRRTSCPCHDEFRGPRSDYVRQVASENNNNKRMKGLNSANNSRAPITLPL